MGILIKSVRSKHLNSILIMAVSFHRSIIHALHTPQHMSAHSTANSAHVSAHHMKSQSILTASKPPTLQCAVMHQSTCTPSLYMSVSTNTHFSLHHSACQPPPQHMSASTTSTTAPTTSATWTHTTTTVPTSTASPHIRALSKPSMAGYWSIFKKYLLLWAASRPHISPCDKGGTMCQSLCKRGSVTPKGLWKVEYSFEISISVIGSEERALRR